MGTPGRAIALPAELAETKRVSGRLLTLFGQRGRKRGRMPEVPENDVQRTLPLFQRMIRMRLPTSIGAYSI
jgi:hypothetical protein